MKAMEQVQAQVMKTVEQAQARVIALEKSQRAAEEEKNKLKARSKRVQQAHQVLRKALTTEEAKTKELTKKLEQSSKVEEKSQDHAKDLEERYKGWLMKLKKEIEMRREQKRWGKDFYRALERIFF